MSKSRPMINPVLPGDPSFSRIKSCLFFGGFPMRSTQQFSITLPNEMAELVRSKVACGEYATESEVIREGLRALLTQDKAVESWLKAQVGPAYDALKADPSKAINIKNVRERIAEEHSKASGGR
jgi:antitoxin ParD1/3/4